MRILLLGRGKTGSLVAEVAAERGHGIRSLTERENVNGSALTPPFLIQFDAVIDFTTPQAALANIRSCLAAGSRIVVGTTGWYDSLPELRGIAERRGGALLYSSNFSIGVQLLFQLARNFGEVFAKPHGYAIRIDETHHTTKLDAPSGTALELQRTLSSGGVTAEITSHREGDAVGTHTIEARSAGDRILIEHESYSRRSFAEGAVRAAEWLEGKSGVFDYGEIFSQL
jgi:4-hydroxy-tetrahydrodipicolinate reductase